MAFNASVSLFKRVYNNPDAFISQTLHQSWPGRYNLNWSYYIGSALDEMATWAGYRTTHRLYYGTRNIYNPTRRLVDFYAGTIYPGTLTADAKRFEDGTVIAIPFAEDTDSRVIAAIASTWKWSNWHIQKGIMIRYAAATGECLVEIVDDLSSRKIEYRPWFPSAVTALELDFRGNVKGYTIEYDFVDEGGVQHRYKKVVDGVSFRTYRDNTPYGYDEADAVMENPYGFVPAVWVKHIDVGTSHGEPCMRYISKWDELNSLASHWMDHAHRVLQAPVLVTGDNIQTFKPEVPEALKNDPVRPEQARGDIPMLRGPVGSDIVTAEPPSGEVMAAVEHVLAEIEKDHPELTMHREMRKMSQVTGPAVSRLFGDVDIMVNEARNSYDTQMVKLFQMAVAIGGYRVNSGDWGELTEDRQVFRPFSLDSYEAGDLDFEIAARPLVPLGRWETIQSRRSEIALEREEIMLAQLKANPTADGSDAGGMPSGDQANQISARLRMRSPTEGVLSTTTPPSA